MEIIGFRIGYSLPTRWATLEEGLRQILRLVLLAQIVGLSRSNYYRRIRSSLESRRIRKEVLEQSAEHPRYGYRRITALMRHFDGRDAKSIIHVEAKTPGFGFAEKVHSVGHN
jgi:hypothetical protein